MATQALDTNDMQQATLGRTLNTATRIPQGLLDRRQQSRIGQNVSVQPNTSGLRPVQQYGSGGMIGNMFGKAIQPVYSAVAGGLPQNVYDWTNAQWAQYFGSKGPSNTWDQDTWKMFQMVSSYSPGDWHSRRRSFGMAPTYFNTELSQDFYNLENLPQSPYQKIINSRNYAEDTGWFDYYQNLSKPTNNLNPGAEGYRYGQRQYMAAAKGEIEREMALLRAYSSLEKYAAQKSQNKVPGWIGFGTDEIYERPRDPGMRGSVDEKTSWLLDEMYKYMNSAPQRKEPDGSQNNIFTSAYFQREEKKEAPRTMEQVREYFGGTPMLAAGYSLDNLPQYNPSFTVNGVGKFTDENRKPWVNAYIKKEVNKQKAAGDYHVNKPMSESGIQGLKPQSELLAFNQNKWRKFT